MSISDSSHSRKEYSQGAASLQKRVGGIEIIFDTRSSESLQRLEDFKSAFGEDYTVEEYLSDGRVMLTILPGGAKGLL